MKMFQITTYYEDWTGEELYKKEETESWEQAFGAFSIYVMDPECVSCRVDYCPGGGEAPVETLTFNRTFNN